jgi:hypothetical protein
MDNYLNGIGQANQGPCVKSAEPELIEVLGIIHGTSNAINALSFSIKERIDKIKRTPEVATKGEPSLLRDEPQVNDGIIDYLYANIRLLQNSQALLNECNNRLMQYLG